MRRLLACIFGIATALPASAADFDCIIEAHQNIEVRSPVEAVIESVEVRRGDLVRKGQVLVTLQSGPERAALELARSRAQMSGELLAAEARLELAQKKHARAQELYKQNFVSVNALDEAEAEMRFATEQLRQAKESQKLAQLEEDRAAEVLALRTIRSPLSGVVVEVTQQPGEFATSNLQAPIVKLAQIDPLDVEVILPVSMYGKINRGDIAVVMPEQPVGGRHRAKVSVVDRTIDAASGTFGVQLALPNPGGKIPAGARCRVRFP
ncbi:MAG: efflux RND transporter periplasmic adaptor subunit [Burkholderiales bacterium]